MSDVGIVRRSTSALAASKVPEVTLMFWVAKLLTTGMGETTWDWMDYALGKGLALGLSGAGLAVALIAQFSVRRYNPWIYWFAVVMVSVFGTTMADSVHNDFGVPYTVSTLVLVAAVAATFALWHRVEGTLDIHSIRTRRREGFYWTAVLLTFALGTALGDWTASTLHLGYLPSGLMFLVIFALPFLARRALGLGAIAAFWLAYIVTRPLGASFADYVGGPSSRGGLELGMGVISLILTAVIVGVVAWFHVSGADRPARLDAATSAR